MVVCLTGEQACNLRYRGISPSQLQPVRLDDGRYAVGEGTLNDRRLAEQRPLLLAGSIESASLDAAWDERIRFTVDSKEVFLLSPPTPHAISIPSSNLYRFECRHNEFGWVNDEEHDNRHNELIGNQDTFALGETLWSSFSFVVGPEHAPFDYSDYTVTGVMHNTIFQWHAAGTSESGAPVLSVEMVEGNLEVWTRSDADLAGPNSGAQVRYSVARPTDGTVHSIVIQGTLGEFGHLNVWLNGSQVADTDCPIGYYNTPGETCYIDWGIYQRNVDDSTIMYHANVEWGTADLSARIANPLSVATPAGGWV
jgi:hypothetical protein